MAAVPSRVIELVETFDRNIDAYRSQQYNETQLRREFIDPFFEQLGWDVTNKAGLAHAYKDVIHEDAITIAGKANAPDYCFRIGGTRKFFLEAKKPSIDIKGDPHPAYQLRRYAWSAKLPLSILTDFEEFAVYDCLSRPKQTDRAGTARIIYLTYKEYLDNWPKIADIFSKDAILKGSFDKFAASTKGKRGTTTVDVAFLAEIEKWRNMLARTIALRNRSLSVGEINFAVQRTIDRILFLRLCEDRGIEQYAQLQGISSGDRTYPRLCEIFEQADQKYNSGLFHFEDEPGRATPPDKLTPNITIDDKDLKWILHNLYYPQCPYEFSVLPPEILGKVYEQFLGKVIYLTPGHQAKIQEKPEVKRAGGIYYTPSYIVHYIVKNTVGKLLNAPAANRHCESATLSVRHCEEAEGRRGNLNTHGWHAQAQLGHGRLPKPLTPKQIEKIKILDPACGSGSFLLGAYTYLLDYHRDWYAANDPEKWTKKKNPPTYRVPSTATENPIFSPAFHAGSPPPPNYRLTIAEKKRILLNNIFGVDIDSQAVEVTKLSLLLKVLEDENAQSLENQHRLFHERALPDLAENIKCGNSLIAPDFFDNLEPEEITDDLRNKINPFDWKQEFPKIFSGKNPGFDAVISNPPYGAHFSKVTLTYLKSVYDTCVWRGESYLLFVEKAVLLLNEFGKFGYIIPDTYLNLGFTAGLRTFLFKETVMQEVVSLPASVFAAPTVDTTLLFFKKSRASGTHHQNDIVVKAFRKKRTIADLSVPDAHFVVPATLWHEHGAFLIHAKPAEIAVVSRLASSNPSLSHYADVLYGIKVYQVGKGTPPQTQEIRDSKPFTSTRQKDPSFFPMFDGKHVGRYTVLWLRDNWVKYGPWIAEPRAPEKYQGEKLLIRKIIGNTLIATYFAETSYCNTLVYVVKLRHQNTMSYAYLLGVLNSKLLGWYFRKKFQISEDDTFPQILIRDILKLPIPTPAKAMHTKMVNLVERMLAFHKQLAAAKIPDEKTRIQRQITATDKKIDVLVYKLYNLTEDEIKIIEESK